LYPHHCIARHTKTPAEQVFVRIFPFVAAMLLPLVVLVAFPGITLWLPSLMHAG
jgi:TRAP-type C4-dicarboxylate transport system permease large subunit